MLDVRGVGRLAKDGGRAMEVAEGSVEDVVQGAPEPETGGALVF